MNIIFLDINGVLIDTDPPFISNTFLFNSEAMTNLSKLIEITNSKIVISSKWKIGMKNPNNIYWRSIIQNFRNYGILDSLISVTPTLYNYRNFYSKSKEISTWLSENFYVTKYIIISSEYLNNHLDNVLVKTSDKKCFNSINLYNSIRLFNSDITLKKMQ